MNQPIRLRLGARGLQKVEWHKAEWNALGSQVSIQLYTTRAQAQQLITESFNWLAKFEGLASRFNADSQVSELNQANGQRTEVDSMLLDTLAASIWAAQKTSGIVDPLVHQQMQAIGYQTSRNELDAEVAWSTVWDQPQHLAQAEPSHTWRQIKLGDRWAQLPGNHQYDPGAVGKGLAADRIAELLSCQVPAVLVDMGGDIRVQVESDLPGFNVQLQDPRSDELWTQIQLQSGAVATSSVCKRLWLKDGQPCHHLLSPADGKSVWSGLAGVAAFAPSALEAETLAKQAVLLGSADDLEYGGILYPSDPAIAPRVVGS